MDLKKIPSVYIVLAVLAIAVVIVLFLASRKAEAGNGGNGGNGEEYGQGTTDYAKVVVVDADSLKIEYYNHINQHETSTSPIQRYAFEWIVDDMLGFGNFNQTQYDSIMAQFESL